MARTYKRGKNWCIDFVDEANKRCRMKVGPNKRQAEEVLDRIRMQVVQKRYLPEQQMAESRFFDLADRYVATDAQHLRWARRVAFVVGRWKAHLGDRLLRDISVADVASYLVERRNEVSPATCNREIAILRRVLNVAIAWRMADRNPLARYKLLKERNDGWRAINAKEAQALVQALPDYLKPLVITALNCGARRGELLALKWEHVRLDLKEPILSFTDTKGARRRDVPANEAIVQALRRLPRDSECVFTRNGRPLGDFRGAFRTACRKAGIGDGFRFHDLRHSYATAARDANMDIRTLQTILGHRTIAMTMRYTHVGSDQLHAAARKVSLGIGGEVRESVLPFRAKARRTR